MHRPQSLLFIIVIFLLILLIDFIVWHAIKYIKLPILTNYIHLIRKFHWIINATFYFIYIVGALIAIFSTPKSSFFFYFIVTFIVVKYIPQVLIVLGILLDYLIFIPIYIINGYDYKKKMFLVNLSILLAGFLSSGFIYGIFVGRRKLNVKTLVLKYKDLPKKFDGLKIAFFSDLHAGSLDRFSFEIVETLSNELLMFKPDILVFGGDWINTHANELNYIISYLGRIDAPLGKYSVLGNHDYGEYYKWPSPSDKENNFQLLKKNIEKMGFVSLDNSSILLGEEGEQIAICGCEYWGNALSIKRGDIQKAINGVENVKFKILITHDPNHFTEEVEKYYKFQLVLSGHTHGTQMGWNFKNFKWSPAKYFYKHWAGLYNTSYGYHYVSTGIGCVGYLGRIGFFPELVLIILKKE